MCQVLCKAQGLCQPPRDNPTCAMFDRWPNRLEQRAVIFLGRISFSNAPWHLLLRPHASSSSSYESDIRQPSKETGRLLFLGSPDFPGSWQTPVRWERFRHLPLCFATKQPPPALCPDRYLYGAPPRWRSDSSPPGLLPRETSYCHVLFMASPRVLSSS